MAIINNKINPDKQNMYTILRKKISQDTLKIVEHVVDEKHSELIAEIQEMKKLLKVVLVENKQLKKILSEKIDIVETGNTKLDSILNKRTASTTQSKTGVIKEIKTSAIKQKPSDLISSLGIDEFDPEAGDSRIMESISNTDFGDYSKFIEKDLQDPIIKANSSPLSRQPMSNRFSTLLPDMNEVGKIEL